MIERFLKLESQRTQLMPKVVMRPYTISRPTSKVVSLQKEPKA